MKMSVASLIFLILAPAGVRAQKDTPALARSLVERSEEHTRGKSFQATATMEVDKAGSKRSISMKMWSVGREKAMVKILEPAKDKGTANLRIDLNFWQYLPNSNRVIKIPPSMMLQSWMGSDFTNDDLVKVSSLTNDYSHKIMGREALDGVKTIRIELTPKPDAPVVWGKIELWVRDPDAVPVRQDFFSEKGELVKRLDGSKIQKYGSHSIPTVLRMSDMKKKNSVTTVSYDPKSIKFDQSIPESVFTQQYLRKPE